MPLRDDRRGRRATVAGETPLRPVFGVDASPKEPAPLVPRDVFAKFGAMLFRQPKSLIHATTAQVQPPIDGPPIVEASPVVEDDKRSFADELVKLIEPAQADDRPRPDGAGDAAALSDEDEALPLVVRPGRTPSERVVPITRLPLRPQGAAITWPHMVPGAHDACEIDDERYALLHELASRPSADNIRAALARAYEEESGEGRIHALRALMRGGYDGRAIFLDALRIGTDEERSIAVDALASVGLRDELIPAFSDRIEAIAAKAVLCYVGTAERDEYRAVLEQYVDSARCEAILGLLAGVFI